MARKTSKRTSGKAAGKSALDKTKNKAAHRRVQRNEKLPALGRMMSWVDKPGNAGKIFWALAVVCGMLFVADFLYEKHGHFDVEHFPGFYGIYGFVMFTIIILAAKTLRIFVLRPEDYYGNKAVDREEYPADQLGKVTHDGT
ncbi:MAG: hypothetical protein KDE11_13115 [Rhodobacteraceae bacterium]|nr:hypothetical protein [Paracoccaceae bacterium]